MKTRAEKIARIAALFAVSNLGHFHNIKVEKYINDDPNPSPRGRAWSDDAYSEVCGIAGHLMENEEHEQYFGDEARGWQETFKDTSIEDIAKQYKWHSEWLLKIAAIPEG